MKKKIKSSNPYLSGILAIIMLSFFVTFVVYIFRTIGYDDAAPSISTPSIENTNNQNTEEVEDSGENVNFDEFSESLDEPTL